jgi:hypothetical protein
MGETAYASHATLTSGIDGLGEKNYPLDTLMITVRCVQVVISMKLMTSSPKPPDRGGPSTTRYVSVAMSTTSKASPERYTRRLLRNREDAVRPARNRVRGG